MAYDPGHAELMGEALSDTIGISEKKMFGGLLLYAERAYGVRCS